MLGIKIDEKHKHAVVYTGNDGDVLLFINNKPVSYTHLTLPTTSRV